MQQFFKGISSTTCGQCATSTNNNSPCHFEIQSLQCVKEARSINTKNKLSNYEFFWINNGKAVLTVDLQQYAIRDKTMIAICPGQVRQLDNQADMDGYYISLSPDFFYAAEASFISVFSNYETVKRAVVLAIDETNQEEMEDILLKMKKESTHYSVVGTEILRGLFRLFLLYLCRKFTHKELATENRRDKCLVKKFTELLCHQFKTKKMVVDYANELCVTPSYLNQVVKKVSGFTASHHIQQCLIQEAKRQAIHSGCSMKEIAYDLGFDDTAHFSKFFKNNSGLNFTSFKKTILSNSYLISA